MPSSVSKSTSAGVISLVLLLIFLSVLESSSANAAIKYPAPAITKSTVYNDLVTACGFGPSQQMTNYFHVTNYGAVPNDGLDDRTAIQATIDAANSAGGGIVYFPPGEYLLSIDQSLDPLWRHALRIYKNVHFFGSNNVRTPSILKLMNNQGSYRGIFGNYNGPGQPPGLRSDISNIWFAHITIDQNKNNNLHYDAESDGRAAIQIMPQGGGVSFGVVRSKFLNAATSNTVNISGNVRDTCVANNEFREQWGCRLHPSEDGSVSPTSCALAKYDGQACEDKVCHDADSSTVYVESRKESFLPVIKNNLFLNPEAGIAGSRTAIETHGSGFVVTGNKIVNYGIGMNLTNISRTSHSSDNPHIVDGNKISGARNGLVLWSRKYDHCAYGNDFYFAEYLPADVAPPEDPANPCPAYDPAVEPKRFDLDIRNNLIILDPVKWRNNAGFTANVMGISIDRGVPTGGGSWAPFGTITIANNRIEYPRKLFPAPYVIDPNDPKHYSMEWYSAGISLHHHLGGKIEKVEISGNTILNPLANGIYIYTNIDDLSITANSFTNTGTTHLAATNPNLSLAAGVHMAGSELGGVPLIRIENNCFVDDQATRTMGHGLSQHATIDKLGCSVSGTCTAQGNYYELPLAGGTVTDFLLERYWNYAPATEGCPDV